MRKFQTIISGALLAGAMFLAPQARAENLRGQPALVLYGSMVCDSGEDALVLSNRLRYPPSCRSAGPAWAHIPGYDTRTGKLYLTFENGREGFLVNSQTLMLCRDMLNSLREYPQEGGVTQSVYRHCGRPT